ncbi:MAG: amino acid adenylation domain-containing protein [Bacteroidetes bacterium]|nr:amino acid adenylation domain-containing protein [Bacteroidota bacterium]
MINNLTILKAFAEQVSLYGNHLAVKYKDFELSYIQLELLSNQVANALIEKGIRPNDLVPICLHDPLDMVIGIWGILKAGAAFVPIDPLFPTERIQFIIKDAESKIILSAPDISNEFENNSNTQFLLTNSHWANLSEYTDQAPKIEVTGLNIAYVIYTSGSTGAPKGALISHGSVCDYLNGLFSRIPYAECKNYALGATFAADFVITHLFGSLTHGSTLHVFTKEDYNDVAFIHQYFTEHQIDCIKIVPSHWRSLSLNGINLMPRKILMFAGEALYTDAIRDIIPAASRSCILVNLYGPTETTVAQLLHVIDEKRTYGKTIPIGTTFTDAQIYILNEKNERMEGVCEGELYIAGNCVGIGYLNRPELTKERFLQDRFSINSDAKMYKTGDIVRRLEDGNIEFVGRVDDQVKIRGYRIELGEIESTLQRAPGVNQCVVQVKEGRNGDNRLVGYVICPEGFNKSAILSFLETHLPDYMVPRLLMHLSVFPFLANGKIDKKALPNPVADSLLKNAFVAPTTETEKVISTIWKDVLGIDRAGAEDNFFELGGSSLLSLKFVDFYNKKTGNKLPVVKLYQFPKLKDLANYLDGRVSEQVFNQASKSKPDNDVAIIGMSARLPGAESIEAYWQLLTTGKESVTFFNENDIDASISDAVKNNKDYVPARGILSNVKAFDAAFFGISSSVAKVMDPQQRLFLEIAWEALEQSGYSKENAQEVIGVFAGVNSNTYFINNVMSHPELLEQTGSLRTTFVNDKDYVATRTSYTFDLKGPAVNVQSACSTSLVAIAQAVQSIRSGQCSMALAGGVSITVPVHSGHLYEEGAMFSKDGHCRPFDACATGTTFSDGGGVVLLKSKAQAIKDGDVIYAVIKGVGISNDGGGKGSFMAPNAQGQAAAIRMAIDDAGIQPDSISYIESHGTATPLGDPIEIEGLKLAFGNTIRKQYCGIGSVKGNFGHLTIASGVAGIIKTALSLYHQKMLPSINFSQPNPLIDFSNSPFYVNTQLTNWKADGKRIAGVSSFGVGGTNAHIVLEEGEGVINHSTVLPTQVPELLCWSAKTAKSLEGYGQLLSKYLAAQAENALSNVAYTLHTHRSAFDTRCFTVADNSENFQQQIKSGIIALNNTQKISSKSDQIVFAFPGQGDQYVNMCRSLYESNQLFHSSVDYCAQILRPYLDEDLLEVLFPTTENEANQNRINETRYSQPALFVISYSLAKLWMSWGIQPSALIGHSIGEFVAACLAGIFSLEDALKLIATRGKLMYALPKGSMLSVRLSESEIQPYLNDAISLAAINSSKLCVVSGQEEHIAALAQRLNEKEIPSRILSTSHAFHSHMMEPVVSQFEELVRSMTLHTPSKPIASTVTGKWMTNDEAIDPKYWAAHLRKPVMFGKSVQTMIDARYGNFLEVGAGKSVSVLIRQQAGNSSVISLASLEREEATMPSQKAILFSLGQLWIHGFTIDWSAYYSNHSHQVLHNLPTYVFDKQEYWVEAIPRHTTSVKLQETEAVKPEVISSALSNDKLLVSIKEILENASGIDFGDASTDKSFIQLGLDSLSLTQVALLLKKKFAVSITFRQLNESINSIRLLSDYLLQNQTSNSSIEHTAKNTIIAELTTEEQAEIKKPFGAIARIEKSSAELNASQQAFLEHFIHQYNEKTKGSKNYTQQHRAKMADPRVVSGFRPATKELVYSIVVKQSKGSRLWDIDGNEYIDALNGFGSTMLGYQPEFIKSALQQQLERGYEIGPQHELAGEVCEMICSFTNFDRAALCNTGSEAVLGALRISRTITGRSLVVAFTGSYHGINDEAIARSNTKLKTYPAASGILPESVQNMLYLEYGTEESLRIIEERGEEIAAVLVEPVQSRRCDFQPISFLKKLRKITEKSNAVLIFDEIISGFRFHQGGVQAMFGIKADLATYGKVVGGGMSLGVIAGKKQFMDALDGGWWQFGDDSMPEVGVTYFAGTFVRHPLTLAAAKATLEYFKTQGPSLQEKLNENGLYLAEELNAICRKHQAPLYIAQFGSLWRVQLKQEFAYSELFFAIMRLKGIHMLEGFPCFVTTAHTEEDLQQIIKCFEDAVRELKAAGIMPDFVHPNAQITPSLNRPPIRNARLGRDRDGNPAWFIPDEKKPGKYIQVSN